MWERFSYYGMRALLILYMTADGAKGGLHFDVTTAGAIYGLYTALVYLSGLPGGWIADRLLGQRRAVFLGGSIIASGHICLAFHGVPNFYAGLLLIILGTGLLKPNVSALVGGLYEEKDERRDAGFSIFYMGINLGAIIAPIVCGWLGQKIDWHYGFGAAAIGMILGLVQFSFGVKRGGLEKIGGPPPAGTPERKNALRLLVPALAAFAALLAVVGLGILPVTPARLTKFVGAILVVLPFAYFVSVFARSGWSSTERKKISVIFILFLFSCLFWAAFEQAGSTLNLFANRFTDCSVLGWSFPSSWFQSAESTGIVLFAPVLALLWVRLKERNPSSPSKFAMGLFLVSAGYLVIWLAANVLAARPAGGRVGPGWLLVLYALHSLGELCLSPVALSTFTKLSPKSIVGQMIGVYFLGISVGNFIGGQIAGLFEAYPLTKIFLAITLTTAVAGLLNLVLVRPIRRLMGEVR
jgi:POT family proton-dependent oligopeptide transporter